MADGPNDVQLLTELWLKTADATFRRAMELPALGPAREWTEALMRDLSSSSTLTTYWLESLMDFQTVFVEALRKTQENMSSHIEEDIESDFEGKLKLESYKDFYRIWIETYSDTFKEFLKSERFSRDMANFLSQSMDFQKDAKEILEQSFLKPANLPTKSEISELEAEIFHLKKRVNALTKVVNGLTDLR